MPLPWSPLSVEPWFSSVQSPHCRPQCRWPPLPLEPCAHCTALPLYRYLTIVMVRTRGGSRLRPRVRFSTPEQEEQALATTSVPDPVLEELQEFRRYQTRMGPRAPSLVPQRRSRRARPSKRAWTSGPGESSSSKPQPSPSPVAEGSSSPIYRLPQGSGDPYSSGPRFRGT